MDKSDNYIGFSSSDISIFISRISSDYAFLSLSTFKTWGNSLDNGENKV